MRPFFIKLSPIIFIAALGIIVYSNSLLCSFHFDDDYFIVNNLAARNIQHLQNIWDFLPSRFVLYLSFALNYCFSQHSVWGYHVVNIIIHIISAILVWWLVLLTLLTPAMKENKIAQHAQVIALLAGLVFVSHPIQTEAVTYILQRAASLATLFYLASLCLYVKARLSIGSGRACPATAFYVGSLISAILAMFTKEITITLPLMILLYEFSFFRTKKNFNGLYVAPFLCALLIIPLTMFFTQSGKSVSIKEMTRVLEGTTDISSMNYLLTQFKVIVTYIKLVFLPLNQNIDYDYPIVRSILEAPAWASLLFLTAILFGAKHLFAQYRLVSFSILWFFLTLMPESSVFPIKDVIFEHRLYLPMVGFSLFLTSSLFYLLGRNSIKGMVIVLALIIAGNSFLTYQRNKIWKNEITLWTDAIEKSPHKARPYNNLGVAYSRQGNSKDALLDYNKAIEINPQYAQAYTNRGNFYSEQGNFTQALADYNKAIGIDPKLTTGLFNRGNFFSQQGDFTKALCDYSKVIELSPHFSEAYNSRGNTYRRQGNFIQALADLNKALELDPEYAAAFYNRGLVYDEQGDLYRALLDYSRAIEINPKSPDPYEDRAHVYYHLKEFDRAWRDVRSAKELGYAVSPSLISALRQVSAHGRE